MIPIAKPFFDDAELKAIIEPLKSGWVSQGVKTQAFEDAFKSYISTPHAAAVSSGTAAIHLALLALGIKPGDEVITSPFTCVASIHPIEFVGATPVFADIDLNTFNINPEFIEEKITPRTKAIMPIHHFGLCCNMKHIMEIAQQHNLKVIEDAALALGAHSNNKHAGTFGDIGCFSFHPRKMITTGEGGMVVTHDEAIDKKIRTLRNYGTPIESWKRHTGKLYETQESDSIGLNYKMTDIHASIGITQLQKISIMLQRRKTIAERYTKELRMIEWLQLPSEPAGFTHAYQSYVCLFKCADTKKLLEAGQQLRQLMEWLNQKGIATVQGTQSIHTVPYYKKKYHFKETDFPNTLAARMLSIALPLYPDLSEKDQSYIIQCVKNFKK